MTSNKPLTLNFVLGQIYASSVSNILGLIIGHPLDTIKVRMQLSAIPISLSQCVKETIKHEGVLYILY